MSNEFPKDCDVEDEEGLAKFSVHVNSHQDRLAVQSEKLGAGILHDTESKMEEFKKQLAAQWGCCQDEGEDPEGKGKASG